MAIGLVLSSCSTESESKVTFHGVNLDASHIFVDAVSLDSMSFASGAKRWTLRGLLINEGVEYPYSMIYSQNPTISIVEPLYVSAPKCLQLGNESPSVKLTHRDTGIAISWRTEKKFLYVETVVTSRH